jgi:hypothetical protein
MSDEGSQQEEVKSLHSVEVAPEDEPEPTNILKEEIAAEGLSVVA